MNTENITENSFKARMERLEQAITMLSETTKELTDDVKYIKKAIGGDDQIGLVGIVQNQIDHRTRIEALEMFKKKVYGYALGLGAGAGAGGAKVFEILFGG